MLSKNRSEYLFSCTIIWFYDSSWTMRFGKTRPVYFVENIILMKNISGPSVWYFLSFDCSALVEPDINIIFGLKKGLERCTLFLV